MRNGHSVVPTVIFFLLTLGLTGCGGGGGGSDDSSDNNVCETGQDYVSFSQQVIQVFAQRCVECHSPGTTVDQRPYLSVQYAYDVLVENPVVAPGVFPPPVTPGNPGDSMLYRKIIGDPREGERMPPENYGPALTDQQICLIENWILEGAVNN